MRFLFVLLLTSNVCAQIGTGQWRLHVPNRNALDVDAGNNMVYTAFEDGLMEYDISANETSLWTDVNALSDITLTCLEYYGPKNAVYVGYANGNLDKIVNNTVTNIPDIRLAQVTGLKRINRIVAYQNYIYVATGFSIVKIDPVKDEVRDTYYPTNGLVPIVDVTFRNDSIFALTSTKMYRGYTANPALADPGQWVVDSRVAVLSSSSIYKDIEVVDDQLYLLFSNPVHGQDSVFNVKNTGLEFVTNESFDLEINSIGNNGGKLAVNIDGGTIVYNSDYSHFSSQTGNMSVNNSFLYNDITWMADNNKGLIRYFGGNGVDIQFQGPPANSYYAMDCKKGKMLVTSGGLQGGTHMTYNSNGVYSFEDEVWKTKDKSNQTLWMGKNIWDYIAVAVHPTDTKKIAVGTFSSIPLSIVQDGEQVADTFTVLNSPLQSTIWNPEALITDLQYDESGNLWIANSFCSSPLKVYTKDGAWQTMSLGSSMTDKAITQIAIDFNGNKWMSVSSGGLMGLNDNKTISTLTDDKTITLNSGATTGNLPSNNVTAIAVDFNNEIWIGTDNGFAILYNSQGAFDASVGDGSYNAQRIKLEFEGNVEYVLGNTSITDIEVDGGNRKWFGTENAGIFLLSADGSQIVQSFTTDNSPLISNNILEMEFNQMTGELFIITDKGLISYRADASYEDPEYSDVKVFPNPVKPDFSGPITIQGIRYDSDIHVTDVAGNLVYKTTSNGGTATWDGKTLLGERVKSGVYLIWTAPNTGKGRKVGKVVFIN